MRILNPMSSTVVVTCIVAPALFWALYHYYRDRHRPEPVTHTALAFGLGALSGALGQQLYNGLQWLGLWQDPYQLANDSLLGLLAYSVLGIGLVEESAKLLPFLIIAFKLEHFDEPVDGIIYAAFVALGFATYENLFYLDYLSTGEQLARGITGPLVHIMFASLWGYPIGRAILAGRPLMPAVITGLATSAAIHGVYDFLVIGLPAWARVVAAALILAVWLRRMALIEKTLLPAQER